MRSLSSLQSLKGLFLLLLAATMMQSCTPAGYIHYIIFNQSDGQLSFVDCNKNTTIIPRDGYVEVSGLVGISGDNLDCFRKRDLVVAGEDGRTWRYQLWDNRAVRSALGRTTRKVRERELEDFIAPPPHPTAQVYFRQTTIIPLVGGRDGAIRPVRWEAFDVVGGPDTQLLDVSLSDGVLRYVDRKDGSSVLMKARPVFLETGLPAGFPIKPMADAPSR